MGVDQVVRMDLLSECTIWTWIRYLASILDRSNLYAQVRERTDWSTLFE